MVKRSETPSSKSARVVIVEDDSDVRDSLCALVKAFGYESIGFESAEQALDYEQLAQCECLLVDFNLPGMSGMDLLSKLQKSGQTPAACLYTGQSNPRVHEAARTLHNTLVLEKGNDTNSISDYLRRVLGDSH